VILNGALAPASIVAFLGLATGWEFGLTGGIILQLVLLWTAVLLAMRKLVVTQTVIYAVFWVYAALCVAVFLSGVIDAAANGGSAVPVESSELFSLDFVNYGWVFGLVLLYLLGVETPFNMGAEFLSVKNSAAKMVWIGSVVLSVGYIITTIGILLSTPLAEINPVTGVIDALSGSGLSFLVPIGAIALCIVLLISLVVYQSAYARLIFVSGIERHLPRLFTHLNPRTRIPVTALLVQGVISSTMIVVLYSQSSLETTFLYLSGALTVLWLFSGFFFFIPVAIARWKYAERYATESFWRIPGRKPGALAVAVIGSVGTAAGIYYTYTLPFSADIPAGDWMWNVGMVTGGFLIGALVVYYFGRRSAAKLSAEDSLAHLAVLVDEGEPARHAAPADAT